MPLVHMHIAMVKTESPMTPSVCVDAEELKRSHTVGRMLKGARFHTLEKAVFKNMFVNVKHRTSIIHVFSRYLPKLIKAYVPMQIPVRPPYL